MTKDTCDEFLFNPESVAYVRDRMLEKARYEKLAALYKALGDPTRVRILDALGYRELCVCDISALLGMTVSAVSHQLRLLRDSRLVKSRRDGKSILYSLDDDHIVHLFREGLEHIRHN